MDKTFEPFNLKHTLYKTLQQQIDHRIANATKAMQAAESAKNNQTKSSAGDKFETGRAMMQVEEERSKVQLMKALALKNELAKINIAMVHDSIKLGSLVFTNQGNYFLSVGLGKLIIKDVTFYAISDASPIGQELLGKKLGEIVIFRGKEILLNQIL